MFWSNGRKGREKQEEARKKGIKFEKVKNQQKKKRGKIEKNIYM